MVIPCLGCFLLQHIVHKVYHLYFIPEPAITISLGMVVSGLVHLILQRSSISSSHDDYQPIQIISFNNEIFFFGFLPPIIFCSGYHLRRNLFWNYFGAITLLASLGTCISALFIATGMYLLGIYELIVLKLTFMESLAFGGLISSTDPVSTLSLFAKLKVHILFTVEL